MILRTGDLFTTDLKAIGHGVNTDGLMGGGVAALVARKFPDVEQTYRTACARGELIPGDAQLVESLAGVLVVNIASQERPGPDARIGWLERGVLQAVAQLTDRGVNAMAIPQIGCGIGGLAWDDVRPVLEQIERETGFEFEVWVYPASAGMAGRSQ